MRFKDYINEKLNPSQFRNWIKLWKQSGIRAEFDHLFGNKDRIYEPYKGNMKETFGISTESDIKHELTFINTILQQEYEIKDYVKGLAYNKKNKREIKITKILDSFIAKCDEVLGRHPGERKWEEKKRDIEDLKKNFINDHNRSAGKTDYLICYSRHAYDIAGMSTDRGWTSCMTLPGDKKNPEGGSNVGYMPSEIEQGTLIAYLIKKDDKNLQHPVGRMLIKPFYSHNDEMLMVACTGGYGTVPDGMVKQVTEWTKKLNKSVKPGKYSFYSDLEGSNVPHDEVVVGAPENVKEFLEKYPDAEQIKTLKDLSYRIDEWNSAERLRDEVSVLYTINKRQYLFFTKDITDSITMDGLMDLFKKNKGMEPYHMLHTLEMQPGVKANHNWIYIRVAKDMFSVARTSYRDDVDLNNIQQSLKDQNHDLKLDMTLRFGGLANDKKTYLKMFKQYYNKMKEIIHS